MKIKSTKTFMEFCKEIGIFEVISKNPTIKFKKDLKKAVKPKENQLKDSFSIQIETRKNEIFLEKSKNIISKDLMTNFNSKKKFLEELRNEVSKIDCNLKETSTNLVFSTGDINSKVMFIGEAPGILEDKYGEPFNDNSGKLLFKMIDFIGLNKENSYFTNLVFWRPPGDRSPNDEEINICLPLTIKHINIINPDFIVTLGGVSSKAILNLESNIMKVRGKEFIFKNKGSGKDIKVFPMFHPNFLINNPSEKKKAWFDLSKYSKLLNNKDNKS